MHVFTISFVVVDIFTIVCHELTNNSNKCGLTFILSFNIKKENWNFSAMLNYYNFDTNFSIFEISVINRLIFLTRVSARGIRAFELSAVSLGRPLYIYEKRWTRTRDDRYQPLGGFTTNGEPERMLDAIIRRAQDWWADALARTLSAKTWNAPLQRFYLFPPIATRRHLSSGCGGEFIHGRRGKKGA